MIDFDKQIVAALSTIEVSTGVYLPVYYENFITGDITLPCITYVENNNSSYLEGDTLRYSYLDYTVKLWMDNKTQQIYLNKIDEAMLELGFYRQGTNEYVNGRVIQKVMDYEAIGWENPSSLEEGE